MDGWMDGWMDGINIKLELKKCPIQSLYSIYVCS